VVIHHDRARAASFGAEADRYDRARPRYPDALVDDLVGSLAGSLAGNPADRAVPGRALRVLDVGCGTGIAAEAFAARGCDVLGVEPDARMAAVARRKGLTVEEGTFEDWPAAGRKYDLVVSAQAWHWVDPERGPAQAASVLVPGGRLAVFWNLGRHDDATQAALDAAYARHAPALLEGSVALGRVFGNRSEGDMAAIVATEAFGEPEVRHYERVETYTTAEWLDQLPTHSDHALLEPAQRDTLLDAVATVIDGLGGRIALTYDALLVTATRLP
jgi:SAM-dependent methyltransferase